MNYYNEIKNKLIDNEVYSKVKDYSKERNKVKTYFEIGKLLSEAGKEYGKNIIKQYSEKLMIEVGKKYNKSTLFRIKQFYNIFKNQKESLAALHLHIYPHPYFYYLLSNFLSLCIYIQRDNNVSYLNNKPHLHMGNNLFHL